MSTIIGGTLEARMEYAAKRKREMNCYRQVRH